MGASPAQRRDRLTLDEARRPPVARGRGHYRVAGKCVRACLDRASPETRNDIHREVMTLLKQFGHADDNAVVLAQDYVEAVAVKA